MENKYIIVRAYSTHGPYIVERNAEAPRQNQWTLADVAGYARTKRDAQAIARAENRDDKETK